jgi:hypothetical protein
MHGSGKVVTHEQVPGYRFELYDAEPNDVARALAALLDRNIDRCPARARTARRIPRPVVVHDTDTDTTATVAWEQDRATVYNDLAGRPSIIVRADTDRLRDVWRLPVTGGGPRPDDTATGSKLAAGRHSLGQIAGRRIRVTGLLRHPLTALQFLSLLSRAE